MSRTLYRDRAREHPELENRIDQHIVAMRRFGILISLLFWLLIALLGYVMQFSSVGIVIILVSLLGFSASLLMVNAKNPYRKETTAFFYLVFPGTIAFYVSSAFQKIVDASQTAYQELQARGVMIGLAKNLIVIPRKLDFDAFNDIHLVLCSDGLLSVLPGSRQREDTLPMLEEKFVETLAAMSADDDVAVVSIRRRKKVGGRRVG